MANSLYVNTNHISSDEKLLSNTLKTMKDLQVEMTRLKRTKRSVPSCYEDDLENFQNILNNANQSLTQFLVKRSAPVFDCCACPTSTTTTTTTTTSTTSTATTSTSTTQLKQSCKDQAIIVSGGWPEKISVELYHQNFTYWKSLPDLMHMRAAHTQSGLIACGGTYSRKNCEVYSASTETWTEFDIAVDRHYHTSWSRPNGSILIGGWSPDAQHSAIKIQENGYFQSFNLINET